MRKLGALLPIVAVALLMSAPAAALAPSSGIAGVVRNTTCPGPCLSSPPPPPLYTGDGLIVKIRDRGSDHVVARLHPADGHFSAAVGPGSYHVRALIRFKGQGSSNCWKGSARNVGIVDQGARVRLTVHNDCVV
jgi:hypothetical protein